MAGNRNGNSGEGFMRVTRAEIAQLKEELTADYKRKLEALELVEQLLAAAEKPTTYRPSQQGSTTQSSFRRQGLRNYASSHRTGFQKQPTWTIPGLASAIGAKNHSFVWTSVNRLAKEGKVRISRKSSGRQPAEYTSVTK
jgi:hypothetical protein